MTVKELAAKAGLEVYAGCEMLDNPVAGGYVSDLLSDVMGFAREGQVWITLQTHKNIIGVASLKDLSAIILVKGFRPDDDTLRLAEEEGIPILGSPKQTFDLAAAIYELLND